jgi:hypothetical protein
MADFTLPALAPAAPTTAQITNQSSGTTTTAGVSAPKLPEVKVPATTQTAQTFTIPPVQTPQTPGVPPSVITSKPAATQATKQIADVTQKTADVAAQKAAVDKAAADKANAEALAKQGGAYAAAEGSDLQAKMKAMSAAAEAKPPAPVKPATGTTSPAEAPKPVEATAVSPPSEKTPEQAYKDAMAANQAQLDSNHKDFQEKLAQMQNGTYPLTADQQAQLDSIKASYDGLIAQQKVANSNYENSIRTAGISAGRNIYAPEIELGNVAQAVNTGISKVSDLNNKMNETLRAARQAIMNDDMKGLSMAYEEMSNYQAQKTAAIKDTYNMSKDALETAQKDYDRMKADLKEMANVNVDPTAIPDSTYASMDKQRKALGLATYDGYSKELYQLQYERTQEASKAADATKQIEQAEKMISIFDKMGMSGEVKIGDHTYKYQGYNGADIATGTETDIKGNVKAWTFNKRTREAKSYDLGIMKAEDGWNTMDMGEKGVWALNAKTGESRPFYASDGQKAWDNGIAATDQIGPALPGHEKNAGQCGAMNNFYYGKGVVGDSLESKLTALAGKAVSKEEVQPGMSFVTAEGGASGHIGFVESVGTDPFGREYITCFESNYHGDGKIDHGRKIYMDDPKLRMISDYPAPNLPKFGSDTPPEILTKTDVSATKPLSSADVKAYQGMGYDVKPGMTLDDVKQLAPKVAEASETKQNALKSAQDLLTKFDAGEGTSAVGFSRVLGWQMIPGTAPKDFEVQFNNLKSLLSLDNVKLLKGQGQVSDAERRLLSEASAKLDLAQSESEFRAALVDVNKALSGSTGGGATEQPKVGDTQEVDGLSYTFDGTNWVSE